MVMRHNAVVELANDLLIPGHDDERNRLDVIEVERPLLAPAVDALAPIPLHDFAADSLADPARSACGLACYELHLKTVTR